MFVGFELVVGAFDGGVGVGGIFEFDDDEGDAVDEEDEVGAFGLVVFGDGELVGDDEFVVVGMGEVDRPDAIASFDAVFLVGDGDAFGEVAMENFVVGEQVGGLDAFEGLAGGGEEFGGAVGVDAVEGGGEAIGEEDLAGAGAVGVLEVGVALGLEELDGEGFDRGFVEF